MSDPPLAFIAKLNGRSTGGSTKIETGHNQSCYQAAILLTLLSAMLNNIAPNGEDKSARICGSSFYCHRPGGKSAPESAKERPSTRVDRQAFLRPNYDMLKRRYRSKKLSLWLIDFVGRIIKVRNT
jgi:hypothetical protein